MSKWDKLIIDILKLNKNIRFEELVKALSRMGYKQGQPNRGSSHYTFRKKDCNVITIPKTKGSKHIDIVYIQLVKEAVEKYYSERSEDDEKS